MSAPAEVSGRDPVTGRVRTIRIDAGRIDAVCDGGPDEGAWLAAGLFDLQINGFAGHDFNEATVDTVRAATVAVLESGTSVFLPTLITGPEDAMVSALRAIHDARDADPLVHHAIPAIHMEGPHIAPEDGPRGAHPLAHVRAPDLALFARLQAASGGLIGLVTMSPHWPQAADYIAALTAQGVRVAIGHTGADAGAIAAAVAAGARLSTHLGNGIAATLPRHPNPIWTQLAKDGLMASFIADGHHLDADTLKAMLRAKGLERSLLVSDAVALSGLEPGRYQARIGGAVDLLPNGRLQVAGTPFLAGATATLVQGVDNVIGAIGLSLADALALATAQPRRLFDRPGVEVGAPADLVRFRWQPGGRIAVEAVWTAGMRVGAGEGRAT
jgi:N-acetylglucosamine-6-phosphate deacetylase